MLDGNLRLTDGSGATLDVAKKKTATFDLLLEHQQPTVAREVLPEPNHVWDHNAEDYHARVANVSAFNSSPYSYGINDMAYYGSFADECGMGMMWRPYFVSAGWDPYANGSWAWYHGRRVQAGFRRIRGAGCLTTSRFMGVLPGHRMGLDAGRNVERIE